MNEALLQTGHDLPKARAVKRKWNFSMVWLVPLGAALVAGYLIYHRAREFGETITIRFRDVSGIRPGQTMVKYRGVDIGQVSAIEMSEDQQSATLEVRLRRNASALAREGSTFWIARPHLGLGSISSLGTLFTGPNIEVLPGSGRAVAEFRGLEHSPKVIDPQGLTIILLAREGGSEATGLPIYYRGIEVGAVRETRLSTNATAVEIHCVIRRRYAALVRPESKFWNVTGLDVRVGLFRGAELSIESLKSLLIGGIAFATPEETKDKTNDGLIQDGMVFQVHEEAEEKWLEWSPELAIPPDDEEQVRPANGQTRDQEPARPPSDPHGLLPPRPAQSRAPQPINPAISESVLAFGVASPHLTIPCASGICACFRLFARVRCSGTSPHQS